MRVNQAVIWISTILFISCDLNSISKMNDESASILNQHKDFFNSLSFTGKVVQKKYCAECQLNKYQLIIDLQEKNPEQIQLSDLSYQPFYFFRDNELIISVTKQLYEEARENVPIVKMAKSDSVLFESNKYILISKKNKEWLPR